MHERALRWAPLSGLLFLAAAAYAPSLYNVIDGRVVGMTHFPTQREALEAVGLREYERGNIGATHATDARRTRVAVQTPRTTT